MERLEKASKFRYVVEPFMEDFKGGLAWNELGNRLLAAAGMHADSHGFGMRQLLPQHQAWVLSRMIIRMDEMPRVGEEYYVETWIRSIYRTFTDRCFAVLRPDGTAYGYAYTTWALINTETRMPVNLENLPDGGFQEWVDAEKPCDAGEFSRIRVKAATPERMITAHYSDIDINRHVNSIRYISHVLDLFTQDYHQNHRIASIEMAYSGEAHCDDRLALYMQPAGDGTFDVETRIQADDGKEKKACASRITFK